MHASLFDALHAPGRSPEIPDEAAIYDVLIGDWEGEVVDYHQDGQVTREAVEIHFGWILEGRAIQDVWISPPRHARGDARPTRCGTTIRVYDPKSGAWRITWINPATGAENRLVGRRAGPDIVQEGRNDDGTLARWSFREITGRSFRWQGEISADGGRTWTLQTEFFARRKGADAREALWSATQDDGFEHVRLTSGAGGLTVVEGTIVRRERDARYRAAYRIECDPAWRVRLVSLEGLLLRSDGEGHWLDAGHARLPALDGCLDVDIAASPFTNTLAIRRLELGIGDGSDIRAVYVDPANRTARPVAQRYTRIADAQYRYESLDSGFTAELPVDEQGLLLEYPGYFKRVW